MGNVVKPVPLASAHCATSFIQEMGICVHATSIKVSSNVDVKTDVNERARWIGLNIHDGVDSLDEARKLCTMFGASLLQNLAVKLDLAVTVDTPLAVLHNNEAGKLGFNAFLGGAKARSMVDTMSMRQGASHWKFNFCPVASLKGLVEIAGRVSGHVRFGHWHLIPRTAFQNGTRNFLRVDLKSMQGVEALLYTPAKPISMLVAGRHR